MFAFADFNHACAAAAFAPVVFPIAEAGVFFGSAYAAVVDLVHVFPAGNAEAAGNHRKTVFVGVQGGALETHIEAHGAAAAAFGIHFHAFSAFEPVVDIVIGVDKRNTVFFGKGDVFVFADFVFFFRVDIGVVEIDGEVDAAGEHGFHHFAGTGGAAGVQQHFFLAVRRNQLGAVDGGNFGGVFIHDVASVFFRQALFYLKCYFIRIYIMPVLFSSPARLAN